MRPDGYEKAPPNIRKAFDDGMRHGKSLESVRSYGTQAEARSSGARLVWDAVCGGIDPVSLTVSKRYLESIRPGLPLMVKP